MKACVKIHETGTFFAFEGNLVNTPKDWVKGKTTRIASSRVDDAHGQQQKTSVLVEYESENERPLLFSHLYISSNN